MEALAALWTSAAGTVPVWVAMVAVWVAWLLGMGTMAAIKLQSRDDAHDAGYARGWRAHEESQRMPLDPLRAAPDGDDEPADPREPWRH